MKMNVPHSSRPAPHEATNDVTASSPSEAVGDEPPRRSIPWPSIQASLVILAALAFCYTLFFAQAFLLPVLLAFLLAILLQPFVARLKKIGISEAVGAAIVILIGVAVTISVTIAIYSPVETWIERAPSLLPEIETKLRVLRESVERAKEVTEGLEKAASGGNQQTTTVVAEPGLAERAIGGIQSFAVTALATVVLLYFLLAHGRRMVTHILARIRDEERQDRIRTILTRVQKDLGAYLLTVTVINIGLGIATGVVMALLGMPNPLVWGLLAATLNYMPYLGPLLTIVILTTVSLVTFDTWAQIVVPPAAFLALGILEGQFITPSVVSKRLTLNPIAVFISILFWGWLWGIPGAILAVPILAMIRAAAEHIEEATILRPILG